MKFTVDAKEFLVSLKAAGNVAIENVMNNFPFAEKITLEIKEDDITALSYGGTASVTSVISNSNYGSLNYNCEEEGQATVFAEQLLIAFRGIPSGDVEVSLKKGELKVVSLTNKKYKWSFVTFDEQIEVRPSGDDYAEKIVVNREDFVKGLKEVLFAPAYEEKLYSYMCVLFELFPKKIRFSAGTGGRFAIYEVEGDNVIQETKNKNPSLIIPKKNLSNIVKILSEDNSDNITIKFIKANTENDIPDQFVFSFNGTDLCIYGIELYTKYPTFKDILGYKYPNRIYTRIEEWKTAISGIDLTVKTHQDDIHNTEVRYDSKEECLMVSPRTKSSVTSPISIIDDDSVKSVITGDDDDIWFRCNSDYLREMVGHGNKSGNIQINFDNQAKLNSDDGQKIAKVKPILVKYPDRINEIKDTTERFSMFFTTSNK